MTPTQDERREAVRIARLVVDADYDYMLAPDEIRRICRTLLAAQEAFADRLAPIYASVMNAFDEHGTLINGRPMLTLRDAVLAARAREPK